MKNRMIPFAIVATLLFTGCTHTRTVDLGDGNDPSFVHINTKAQKKKAIVTLANNQTLTVYRLQAAADSTFWWQEGRWEAVPTADIREIQIESRGRSTMMGVASGVAAGLLTSLALGTREVKDDCVREQTECLPFPFYFCFDVCKQWSYRDVRNLSYATGALLGGSVGLVMGMVTKGKDIYRFEAPAPALPVVAEGGEQGGTKQQ